MKSDERDKHCRKIGVNRNELGGEAFGDLGGLGDLGLWQPGPKPARRARTALLPSASSAFPEYSWIKKRPVLILAGLRAAFSVSGLQ